MTKPINENSHGKVAEIRITQSNLQNDDTNNLESYKADIVQFLRIKKLTGSNIIKVATRHNLREIQAELGVSSHIDANRIKHNIVIKGAHTASEIAQEALTLMSNANITPLRHDAVRGLEILIGLPANSGLNEFKYFNDAVAWAEKHFEVPLLSAVIHNDESMPHCHVIMLPLFGGRMIGSGLVGNRQRLQAMQTSFYEQVSQKYGLAKQIPIKRIPLAIRRQSAELAMAELKLNPNRINETDIKTALFELLVIDPLAMMQALGLNVPLAKKLKDKSFESIMTKPVKPNKPIGFKHNKPIGFASDIKHEKHQTLCTVGFDSSQSPNTANDETFTRIKDDEYSSDSWDYETGQFITQEATKIRQVIL